MAIRSLSAIFAPVNTKRSNRDTKSLEIQSRRITSSGHRSRTKLAHSLAKAITASCIAVMAFSAGGCSLTSGACRAVKQHDGLDNFMIGYRNQVLAARAWHEHKHCYANRSHQRDFKAGFMQGYSDVANGSNGCVPSVAPSSYWGWRYQSADGQNAVNAWFAGYPLGAQIAEQDGVNNWSNIRPSGANAPQQRQAVYMPPPPVADQHSSENPFYDDGYSDQRYPYEPVQDESDSMDGSADAESEDDVDSAMDRDASDDMELEDSPPASKDVSDAIREALDAPLGDDSTSNTVIEPGFADVQYSEPPYEPAGSDQVHVMITADRDSEPMVEVIKPAAVAVPQTANADSELRFTFE